MGATFGVRIWTRRTSCGRGEAAGADRGFKRQDAGGQSGVATPVSRALQALLATGAAQWSGRKPVLLPQLVVPDPPVGVKSLADMVIEDRG